MAYSITTEDGITIDNIPDNVDPNSNELKARVAKIRASGGEEKPKEQKASTTFGQDLSRQLGLTARAGATGAAGLPLIAGDALNTLINLISGGVGKVTGTEIPQLQMPSRVLQRGLTQAGLPEAETKGEKVIQDITSAISGVAAATDNTFLLNPAFNVKRVPSAQKEVNVQANTAILAELVKNLEMSRMTLLNETPIFQIIDTPISPIQPKSIGIIKGGIIGGFLFSFLIVGYLVFINFWRTLMNSKITIEKSED